MKTCPKCNTVHNDDAMFCPNCGTSFQGEANQPNNNQMPNNSAYTQTPQYGQPAAAPVMNPYDHTAEFDVNDVKDNKLFALLVYATSILGVVIALIANISKKSAYLSFHINQALKIVITEIIVSVITAVLFWTCIVPIAGGVASVIILVVTIICFFKTCANKSIEVPIIRSLPFLK